MPRCILGLKGFVAAATIFTAGLAGLPASVHADPGGGGTGGGAGQPAPTPAQIARRTTVRIQAVAELATRDIREIALKAAQRIVRAARAGATDDQITAIGADAATRITTRATNALARIDALKTEGLTRITDAGGDADAAAQVEQAATNAGARVNQVKDNSLARVNAVVTRATASDPAPNP